MPTIQPDRALWFNDDIQRFSTITIVLHKVVVPVYQPYIDATVEKYFEARAQDPNCPDFRMKYKDHHKYSYIHMASHMRHYDKITDGKFDASATLTLLEKMECFSKDESDAAKATKTCRNLWAHPGDFTRWTQDAFDKACDELSDLMKKTKKRLNSTTGLSHLIQSFDDGSDQIKAWKQDGVNLVKQGQGPLVGQIREHSEATVLSKLFGLDARHRYFTGRDEDLQRLQDLFQQDVSARKRIITISGLGGVGKSSFALEACYRNFFPGGTYWLSADTQEGNQDRALDVSIKDLLKTLNSRLKKSLEYREDLVDHIKDQGEECLVILDNLDEESLSRECHRLIHSLICAGPFVTIMITSRLKKEQLEHMLPAKTHSIQLGCFDLEEGLTFLRNRIDPNKPFEDNDCHQLLQELGHFPLALDQAAAFIKSSPCQLTLTTYIQALKRDPLKRLSMPAYRPTAYRVASRLNVNKTWRENLDSMKTGGSISSPAYELSKVLAFMTHAPEWIQRPVLNPGSPRLDIDYLAEALEDEVDFSELMAALTKHCLFSVNEQGCVQVHPLVQEVIKVQIKSEGNGHGIFTNASRMLKFAIDNASHDLIGAIAQNTHDFIQQVNNELRCTRKLPLAA